MNLKKLSIIVLAAGVLACGEDNRTPEELYNSGKEAVWDLKCGGYELSRAIMLKEIESAQNYKERFNRVGPIDDSIQKAKELYRQHSYNNVYSCHEETYYLLRGIYELKMAVEKQEEELLK